MNPKLLSITCAEIIAAVIDPSTHPRVSATLEATFFAGASLVFRTLIEAGNLDYARAEAIYQALENEINDYVLRNHADVEVSDELLNHPTDGLPN